MSWLSGEAIVLRQVWQGNPLFAFPVVVISDEPGLLVTYLPERAAFGAVPGWPGGEHPWAHRGEWEGHGTLMLRRPDDRYSIWVFWHGEDREFECWYINLEQPYRRSAIGIDTLDHELDLWSDDGLTWHLKDEDGSRSAWPTVGSTSGRRIESGPTPLCSRPSTPVKGRGGTSPGRIGGRRPTWSRRPCRMAGSSCRPPD